ncbi:MAG: trypsin-like serine protease [Ignavibacteria bacterium]|jgi:hypothetical protein
MKRIYIFVLIFACFNILYSQTWRQYNLQTGQIIEIPFSYTSTATSKIVNGNKGVLPENFSTDTSRAFFPLDIVNDPNASPWRTIIKFNDVTGILIDPYHVLTAGHAIEFHPYFKTVPFIAGYEGADYPFKYAFAENFYLLSNYSPGTSTDIAIVKLDRPIGALSGWNGFGYNNDNSYFLNRTFYNPSYPSVTPFSGEYLFNWKGSFNSIGTEYFFSTRVGYGGMSGSPAYTNINNDNIVYGIITNLGIKFNRITANKLDAINKVIDINTPAQFDLIPLNISVSPKIVKTGSTIENLSFILHNYSYENKSDANITVNAYISTDQQITTSDELIATYSYQKNFNSKSSEIIVQTNSLPAINKPAGNYWIGIIISGDNNSNNNTSKSLDVTPITVVNSDYVTIKGRIVSSQSNSGVIGVSMSGFPLTIKTDYYGNYETQVTTGWNGTVTPTKVGYDFSNISTSYSNITQTTTTNYTAAKKTFSISGLIKSPIAQIPVSNVKISGLLTEPYSDLNGLFSVNVFYGWSGKINLTKGNIWDFEPYSYSFSKVSSNLNNSFLGGFHISGKCFENSGIPISGVELTGFPNSLYSDENGDYNAFVDSGWIGTVIPVKDDKIFLPEERNYENITNSIDMQDFMEQQAITLNLKVFLAGAISDNSDTMSTVLNYKNYLPLTPPDTLSGNGEPFIYIREPGELVTPKFFQNHRNIVDWIIIEIRDFKNMNKPIDTLAAFLRRDGKVMSLSGDSIITLNMNIPPENYYIIIRHRNHLSVMTSNPVYLSSDSYLYDFSECKEQFYGNDAALLNNDKYGMYPGDADNNGKIDINDYQKYQTKCITAQIGYLYTDFNLDGNTTGSDFNIFAPNNKKRTTTNVPNSTLIKFLKTLK